MKAIVLTACIALAFGVLIGRATVASSPSAAQRNVDAVSRSLATAEIPTMPIVPSKVSAGFGDGPVRTTDW